MKKTASPNQLSLFDLLKDLRPKRAEFSSFNIDVLLREAIYHAIKACPLSRYQITAHMSEALGVEITKNMINSWTAESREGINRFPACYLPAFCHVVRSIEPLRILADLLGCFVIESEDALNLELKRIEDQEKELSEKKKAIKAIRLMARR